MAFDQRSFSESRDEVLACWLAPPKSACVAVSHDAIAGYGVVRQCRSDWKIGGLSAIDDRTAAALIQHLAASTDRSIFLDVPDSRQQFIGFLLDSDLRPAFETTRMYLGKPLSLAPELFGVMTLELG
jgi:hypothetical protein